MNGVLSLFSSANEQGSIIAVELPTESGKCSCVLYQTFCEVCPFSRLAGYACMHSTRMVLSTFGVCL